MTARTTRQHADAVAARADVTPAVAAKVLRAHVEEVIAALSADDRVVLTGFGTFRMVDGRPVFTPSETLPGKITRG